MKMTGEELVAKIREHSGESPDEFTIEIMGDITDSFDNSAETELEKLRADYDKLKKDYADRFVVKEKPDEQPEEVVETYDSIFD